ncbi:hypothetical protein B9Z55_010966 [Caenorhabditis nigoni]|uniref:F-box domain-containing protein n=1 Tax=Caenorhabditis nigoni TaxID=1611254 RepID=A0A2G5UIN1_9PELO|nr:hypothetical protein B9Z55_010966 [Caenorhabditis nigoni]
MSNSEIELNSLNEVIKAIEKLPPKERFRLLKNFIRGFEKWSQLNEDCRLHVVQFLDYKSMCKLEICSKQDQGTVKDAHVNIYQMTICDERKIIEGIETEEFDNVAINFQFDSYMTRNYNLVFSAEGDGSKMQWLKFNPRKRGMDIHTLLIDSPNYHQKAIEFAENMIKKGKYELPQLMVDMKDYPMETSKMKPLPRCKTIRICGDDKEQLRWWFEWLPEKNLDIRMFSRFENTENQLVLSSEELNWPRIQQAQKFKLRGRADFTDEQFLNLEIRMAGFVSVSVSDDVINRFLKNWINGTGYQFHQVLLGSTKNRDVEKILRGIELREWDEDFREEAGFFCSEFHRFCGRGQLYQISNRIQPYESLTLQITDFEEAQLNIYHTGKRQTARNGEYYTEYYVPSYF